MVGSSPFAPAPPFSLFNLSLRIGSQLTCVLPLPGDRVFSSSDGLILAKMVRSNEPSPPSPPLPFLFSPADGDSRLVAMKGHDGVVTRG